MSKDDRFLIIDLSLEMFVCCVFVLLKGEGRYSLIKKTTQMREEL